VGHFDQEVRSQQVLLEEPRGTKKSVLELSFHIEYEKLEPVYFENKGIF
jgi:hypothetical protein